MTVAHRTRTTIAELHDATQLASEILTAPPRRAAAVAYLRQRGIPAHALPYAWPLGYAPPGWTRLTDDLRDRGFGDACLLRAGLASRCSRGTLVDVFRDRVMFPVHAPDGSVAGFVGRDLSGAPQAPRYLNTRQTPLYDKASLLYGLNEARVATPGALRPVIVEGPVDVLAIASRAAQAGGSDLLPLATCGTAFGTAQSALVAETVARHPGPVVTAMDSDAAGVTATLATGDVLRAAGLDVLVAVLPNGLDPAAYLANVGADLNTFRSSSALPLLAVQVQRTIAVQGDRMQWVEGRVTAARLIARHLATYPTDYAAAQTSWIAGALGVGVSTVEAELKAARGREAPGLTHPGTGLPAQLDQAVLDRKLDHRAQPVDTPAL